VQLGELPLADVGGELDVLPLLGELADDGRAGGGGEPADLVARVVRDPRAGREGDADEDGLLARNRELDAIRLECLTDNRTSIWGGLF
jgi:hypothetical protein